MHLGDSLPLIFEVDFESFPITRFPRQGHSEPKVDEIGLQNSNNPSF